MLRVISLLAWATLGCASTVDGTGGLDGGPGGRGDGAASRDLGGDVRDIPYFDVRVYDVFREDACGGARPPAQRAYECDPIVGGGCPAGDGCYAFIEYPSVRCGSETYRAMCFQEGSNQPGTFCRSGTECTAGAGCFVTGAMNRCLRLCRLDGTEPRCQRGTVCEPTDLPDFGACQ